MADARRYSGYDEYTGVFGPLQAAPSSSSRSRAHFDVLERSSRRGFASSRVRKGRRRSTAASRDFEHRASYLANRRSKRVLQPLEVDSDGMEEEERDAKESCEPEAGREKPPTGLRRQMWLPTRQFAFRQRAGKLDTRAIARLDLEKIAATTDIESIQKHLENLAFADVTMDDVQQYSDAYFLKLFQIAQLTLEYLMHVQDSLVDHSEGLETQCDQLLTECQELEAENGQHETEISSLKREIRQKQRTMATLELMLLNASAATRGQSHAKENAANQANALAEELLGSAGDEGVVSSPVACVLCKKRFVSAEFLIRHQQRRHQDKKPKKKQQRSGSSASGSDDDTKREKAAKTRPLPREVMEALEERNQLAKQLMALQEQVRLEQEARDRQRQQLGGHQSQLSSQMEQYMGKLQGTLLEIEKKQEATKQDMLQYTQETLARLQTEAANAELLRQRQHRESRAGRLESDEEGVKAASSEEATWSNKVEKLMDTFLRAQAQKQQEIDALEQENSKLWSKHSKLKKRQQRRPEPIATLLDMATVDAQRFGVDRGEVVKAKQPMEVKSVIRTAVLEDKLVQTDDEKDEGERSKRTPTVSQQVQTDSELSEAKVPSIVAPPVRIEATKRGISLPIVPIVVEIPPEPVVEAASEPTDAKKKLQQAAHVIGKVALGFLVRRALVKSPNWRITVAIASLEAVLSPAELARVRQRYDREFSVQVEEEMSANDLRVAIARALSGEKGAAASTNDEEALGVEATMSYHRVLLHHKRSGVELCGGKLRVHEFKNAIEVEVIPYHEAAAIQVDEALDCHEKASDRVLEIRRASLRLSATDLPQLRQGTEEATGSSHGKLTLRGLVRLQALVRGFLAKRNVELLKLDRLMDARLATMSSSLGREGGSLDSRALPPSWMTLDPVLAGHCERVQRRLARVLSAKLAKGGGSGGSKTENDGCLSAVRFEKLSTALETEQSGHPMEVQRRIQLISERLGPMAREEYKQVVVETTERMTKQATGAAAKIQRSVQLEVVRKRLERLLREEGASEALKGSQVSHKSDGSEEPGGSSSPTKAMSASWLSRSKESGQVGDKLQESFDTGEIDQLADAYEEGKASMDDVPSLGEEKTSVLPDRSLVLALTEEKPLKAPQLVQPLTPRTRPNATEAGSVSGGRPGTPTPYRDTRGSDSPRPKLDAHVISPFSKTPLISRRTGSAARRGTGYDNAR
ncbi:hypothetical protein BBJ28_00018521 [Nothophytophthora sp. Chile5]|nr:hypothetical protein BBJ28_00018521 [Nothophytophthora sp. Chile5]